METLRERAIQAYRRQVEQEEIQAYLRLLGKAQTILGLREINMVNRNAFIHEGMYFESEPDGLWAFWATEEGGKGQVIGFITSLASLGYKLAHNSPAA